MASPSRRGAERGVPPGSRCAGVNARTDLRGGGCAGYDHAMNRRDSLRALGAALFGTAVPGCRDRDRSTSRAEPAAGPPGPVLAGARRIVSLSPNTTETVFALGEGQRLVGRSRYCDYPPEVAKVPSVGGYVDASLEAILALVPDLVIGARGPAGHSLADKLGALNIATYFPPTESMAEIETMIRGMSERVGAKERGEALIGAIRARCKSIASAVAEEPRRKVLLVFGLGPVVVAGPESFADELLGLARAENVIRSGGAYPTLSLERIMTLDPDVVLNAAWGETNGTERINPSAAGWGELAAVKAGRVANVTDETLLRPGPRIGNGLAALAHAIHPKAVVPGDGASWDGTPPDGGARTAVP